MIGDTSKKSTDDEEYHSCESDTSDSDNDNSNSGLDSWVWIDPKELAVMNQEQEIP